VSKPVAVDTHHHFWRYVKGRDAWLDNREDFAQLRRDFLAPEFEAHLRASGVDRTVIVQAANTVEDTESMVATAKQFPFIAGIVGWLPLDDPKATEARLNLYADEPLIKGVRHLILIDPDPNWQVRPGVIESMGLLAERGYTWDSNAGTVAHLEQVVMLAERYPHLKQVIDHLGKPTIAAGLEQPWTSLMARIATYPNVFVKISGIGHVTSITDGGRVAFQPFVDHILERFGPQRVMLGSNWPVAELFGNFEQTWSTTLALLNGCSPIDRAQILGQSASRFYGLGL
jgi:L-fuconolactonase